MLLLKEEIRRLHAWYTQEISRIEMQVEEHALPFEGDRQKRGWLALLINKKSNLEHLSISLQKRRGHFV